MLTPIRRDILSAADAAGRLVGASASARAAAGAR
jgi:hypothetical protein